MKKNWITTIIIFIMITTLGGVIGFLVASKESRSKEDPGQELVKEIAEAEETESTTEAVKEIKVESKRSSSNEQAKDLTIFFTLGGIIAATLVTFIVEYTRRRKRKIPQEEL